MEHTQATVHDLLTRLGPGGGHMYLPLDTDSQQVIDLLSSMYGAPRTLVLDGFTDPTLDASGGLDVLAPFEDRAETIRVWAYGNQWFGAGTAQDEDGVVRGVLAVAERALPEPLAAAPGEDVDWVERLVGITGWTPPGTPLPRTDWADVERRLGTELPGDYKRIVDTFGPGLFDAWFWVNEEPWTDLREDGLLIWAGTEHEELYCWRVPAPGKPVDDRRIVVRSFDGEIQEFPGSTAAFICRILTDPHHPYTLARYFDTHWFLSHSYSD
ncbi:hypothetical protein [Streptomyces sp. VRA16 Mangrove soil]|uniref:hypothetical protein n=1 Tax=Streptomyces sp. VRA16 Mangrove soil TaxID=2817434 RepID=UPI001A9DA580|nr:hypothetical protein [Streptomyces sp. VRA16 Mangrove soil]MBO1334783.1 hypothetical protein [Streptomyces sp. VRA16 Mangrove soil]